MSPLQASLKPTSVQLVLAPVQWSKIPSLPEHTSNESTGTPAALCVFSMLALDRYSTRTQDITKVIKIGEHEGLDESGGQIKQLTFLVLLLAWDCNATSSNANEHVYINNSCLLQQK